MKDSGVEWLGDVPAHWEVCRLGQMGRLLKGRGGTKDDEVSEGVPCVRYGDLYTTHNWTIEKSRSCVSRARSEKYTPILYGDVLFAASGETTEDIGKSAVNLMRTEACCGGDVILFRPRLPLDPRFMGYAAGCRSATIQKAAMGRGFTVVHIYPHQIRRIALALPPTAEQTAIARFLDHATDRIDRYIRAKEKLIGLLEEQKRAIIDEAVSGRIDVRTGKPYADYKASGVEWLADVPEHWPRMRLKAILRPVDRRSTTGTETLLSLRRDHGVVVYADHFRRPPQGETLVGFKLVRAGDLVVNRLQANNGLVFSSNLNGVVSPDYSVFETKKPVRAQYLSALVRTEHYRSHFRREARGLGTGTSGFLRLYDDAFLSTIVHLPPPAEQELILRRLDDAGRRMDRSIASVRRQLELMKEFQAGLLADLVTGKLDVRDIAAELPDLDLFAGEVNVDASEAKSKSLVAERDLMQEVNS